MVPTPMLRCRPRCSRLAATRDLPTIAFFRPVGIAPTFGPDAQAFSQPRRAGALMDKSGLPFRWSCFFWTAVYTLSTHMATGQKRQKKVVVRTRSVVQVRVDDRLKKAAAKVLQKMGLSLSDAVRVLLVRVAAEKGMPFDVRVPNAETIESIEAGRRNEVFRAKNVRSMMESLNADD
jgi:DNA-damage-inducible protein J